MRRVLIWLTVIVICIGLCAIVYVVVATISEAGTIYVNNVHATETYATDLFNIQLTEGVGHP